MKVVQLVYSINKEELMTAQVIMGKGWDTVLFKTMHVGHGCHNLHTNPKLVDGRHFIHSCQTSNLDQVVDIASLRILDNLSSAASRKDIYHIRRCGKPFHDHGILICIIKICLIKVIFVSRERFNVR